MRLGAKPSSFAASFYAASNTEYQDVIYTVPRAGHLVRDPEHHIQRDHFPGHELILCLQGQGFVRRNGFLHLVHAGELAWVNCSHPHEHGAIPEDPWEVFWVRIEGPRLEQICELLAVESRPVFSGFDADAAIAIYREIFRLMAMQAADTAPLIHAEVAKLIALAFCARRRHAPMINVPTPIAKVVEWMKLYYFEPISVSALADMAGMSASHFARLFKSTFGLSPINWLRRERINHAKRRLGDSKDLIKEVAMQVGYNDRFFFSRDFKKFTGYTPREFRRRETAFRGQ
jgi:AraC-like DNA-binding protein